jgi:hypothetical protein
MNGIVGLLPGRQMASGVTAIRRRNRQIVVVVDVAGNAARHFAAVGDQCVRIRQWEAEGVVIELAVRPFRDRMARRASRGCRGKARGDVIRHASAKGGRAVPRGLVAAHAVRRIQRVVVVDMAGQARRGSRGRMRSCQCKSRHTMVKGSCIPPLSGMTTGAICDCKRRAGRGMGRIIGLLPGRKVASRIPAIRRRNRQIVVVVDMAGRAGNIGMSVCEQKSG